MEIINQTQMNECMTGEADLDSDLIRSAIDEIESRISDLEIALTTQNYDHWRYHAHRSVGAAATLGFKALADEFRNAEHHMTNDEERFSALISIKSYMQQTRQELASMGII